jgi:hypothetical protein
MLPLIASFLNKVLERDKKSFFNNGQINIWNVLPDTVVTSSSASSFSRNVAIFDFSKYMLLF